MNAIKTIWTRRSFLTSEKVTKNWTEGKNFRVKVDKDIVKTTPSDNQISPVCAEHQFHLTIGELCISLLLLCLCIQQQSRCLVCVCRMQEIESE